MNEIEHIVVDAKTGERERFLIQIDRHGMSVELSNGQLITIDLCDGAVSVYHNKDADDPGVNVCKICLSE